VYVATLALPEAQLLVRVDVQERASLMGRYRAALMTTTHSDGQERQTHAPLPTDEPQVGYAVAALIEAVQSMTFEGLAGTVNLVHCSPAIRAQSVGDVLYAANVKHAIQSLATSATLQ
jgi:hypothetical protein